MSFLSEMNSLDRTDEKRLLAGLLFGHCCGGVFDGFYPDVVLDHVSRAVQALYRFLPINLLLLYTTGPDKKPESAPWLNCPQPTISIYFEVATVLLLLSYSPQQNLQI